MKKNTIGTILYQTLLLSFIGFFLSSCIAGTTIKTQPDPSDPVADLPKHCKGDKTVEMGWWSSTEKNKTWTNNIDKVNEDGSYEMINVLDNGKEERRLFYNNKHQLIRNLNLATGKDEFITNPPANRLNFPLFVGKQWSDNYYTTAARGGKYHYSNLYTVTAYQTLTIKAGQFDVFRIWRINSNLRDLSKSSEIYYYSPQLKTVILSEPDWRDGFELISYSIGKCDQK